MALINGEMKQRSFETDKRWVDKFEPQIKRILGEAFIKTAPRKIDMEEATDLLVMEVTPFRIGCRVRTFNYYNTNNYKNEFTIRNERPSGNKSELRKILRGDINYNFYGFCDENEFEIYSYIIGDLKIFREEWLFNRDKLRYGKKTNSDNSSSFYWFDWRTLPDDFFIKKHIPTEDPF